MSKGNHSDWSMTKQRITCSSKLPDWGMTKQKVPCWSNHPDWGMTKQRITYSDEPPDWDMTKQKVPCWSELPDWGMTKHIAANCCLPEWVSHAFHTVHFFHSVSSNYSSPSWADLKYWSCTSMHLKASPIKLFTFYLFDICVFTYLRSHCPFDTSFSPIASQCKVFFYIFVYLYE